MTSAPPDPGLVPPDGPNWPPSGCQTAVGYVVDLHPTDGSAQCWLDIAPQHLNRHGLLHGGFTAMLLDIACGFTAAMAFDAETVAPVLTVSLTTQYVAPVRAGRVTATGSVTGCGRSVCHASGELRDEGGTLIATALGVFKRVAPKAAP